MQRKKIFRKKNRSKFRPDSAFIADAVDEYKKAGGVITVLPAAGAASNDGALNFFSATDFLFDNSSGGIHG